MELQQFLEDNFQLKLLKWVEIILQEDKAIKSDAMYILVKDEVYCDLIFVDSNNNKRKIENVSKEALVVDFPLKDLSNLNSEDIDSWKNTLGSLSATIQVGEVISLNPGESPIITNSGTSKDAIFNFSIPKGEVGYAATITVGSVESVEPSEPATVENIGTPSDAVLKFEIPKGEKGEIGDISLLTFNVDENMHLIMQLETNTNLDFTLDSNGHLILLD